MGESVLGGEKDEGRKRMCIVLALVTTLALVVVAFQEAESEGVRKVTLRYFGHATFLITAPDGTTILTDPFDRSVGYPMPDVRPSVVTVSHEHFDHNFVQMAKGNPKVIRGLKDGGKEWAQVKEQVGKVTITTVPTYHDGSKGSHRGKNAIFVFEMDGLRLAHLGDLGHVLTEDQVKAVGSVNVVMIPVGGFFTIDAKEADQVLAQIKPPIVIPMHFRTEATASWSIAPVDEFLKGKANVKRVGHQVDLPAELPKSIEIWVMSYK